MRSADSETSGWPPISNNLKKPLPTQPLDHIRGKNHHRRSVNVLRCEGLKCAPDDRFRLNVFSHFLYFIPFSNCASRICSCRTSPPFVMTNPRCTVRDYSCMQMTSNASQDDGSWPRQDLHYISIHYPGPPTVHNPNELIFYRPVQSYLFLVVVLPTLFAQLHFLAE